MCECERCKKADAEIAKIDAEKPPVDSLVMLPCPFCGRIPALTHQSYTADYSVKYDVSTYGRVECDCGARGPDVHIGETHSDIWQAEARVWWNRRA